jgi:uncharacterized membrane protein
MIPILWVIIACAIYLVFTTSQFMRSEYAHSASTVVRAENTLKFLYALSEMDEETYLRHRKSSGKYKF